MKREAIKGVIYPHGEVAVGEKKVFKYIVGLVILSEVELDIPNETVVLDDRLHFEPSLMETLGELNHYEYYSGLGDLRSALFLVSNLNPDDHADELTFIPNKNKILLNLEKEEL